MRFRDIFKILSLYLFGFTFILIVPFLLAIYYQFINPADHPQPHSTLAFLTTIIACGALGLLCRFFGNPNQKYLYKKEGIALVSIIWLLTPAIAALPFIFSGTLINPVQAYFEAVSGLTTTGSTTLQAKAYNPETGQEIPINAKYGDLSQPHIYTYYGTVAPVRNPETGEVLFTGVEAVSKALLFWRSFIQWLGGLGVIVLFVAILPSLGVSGKLLAQSEMPGPIKDAWTPRIKQTALQLWSIYVVLTVVLIVLLIETNEKMELLDAVTLSFSTLSTGGFSIRNESVAFYQNPITDWIIVIFMILGATNFSLFYSVFRGKIYRLYNVELFLFLGIILFTCALASWYLFGTTTGLLNGEKEQIDTIGKAVHYGSFHIISALTSTGFDTVDYDTWPSVVQALLLIVMFVGGMSGSTAGGIKIIRQYILFRIGQYKIESIYRQGTIRQFRVYDQEVNTETSQNVLCFFLFIISISVLGTFLYIMDDIDPQTSLGLVACMINNSGLAFRMAGPTDSFAFLSDFSSLLSSALMLLGRLEFFVLLAILIPSFWKKTT
jgi:trk system potassium uptake protein TrkH